MDFPTILTWSIVIVTLAAVAVHHSMKSRHNKAIFEIMRMFELLLVTDPTGQPQLFIDTKDQLTKLHQHHPSWVTDGFNRVLAPIDAKAKAHNTVLVNETQQLGGRPSDRAHWRSLFEHEMEKISKLNNILREIAGHKMTHTS